MRLIDADELLTAFPIGDEPTVTIACVRATIEHMPTIEPEIVRCKDCKYYGYNECFHGRGLIVASDNTFCSYAESIREVRV